MTEKTADSPAAHLAVARERRVVAIGAALLAVALVAGAILRASPGLAQTTCTAPSTFKCATGQTARCALQSYTLDGRPIQKCVCKCVSG